VFGTAGGDVEDGVEEGGALAAVRVGHGADERAEHHAGPEPGDEEDGDVSVMDSVGGVKGIHVGALEPIPGHRKVVYLPE
jgi:hypothetical protein